MYHAVLVSNAFRLTLFRLLLSALSQSAVRVSKRAGAAGKDDDDDNEPQAAVHSVSAHSFASFLRARFISAPHGGRPR